MMVITRRVQFYEVDLAGLVHFSWYFRYMEEAEHALWRSRGLSVVAPGQTLRFPRVAASCDYRAPLRFEDEFDISIRIATTTPRSIRYECQLTRGDTAIATGSMTVACIDLAAEGALRAVEFPSWILERLQEHD